MAGAGVATPKYRGGQLIAWNCIHMHDHANEAEAKNCDSEAFAKQNREKLDQNEKQRVRQIQQDPDFKKAISDAKALGAADDDAAEEVVLRNGILVVTSARKAVVKLGIKPPQPKATDSGKAGKVPTPLDGGQAQS
jgi:hypothetical protein